MLYGQTGPPEHPSQQSEGIGYPGLPTPADRDLLGKLVQDQVDTARPERRLYTECAAGQEASAEHLSNFCILPIRRAADRITRSRHDNRQAGRPVRSYDTLI